MKKNIQIKNLTEVVSFNKFLITSSALFFRHVINREKLKHLAFTEIINRKHSSVRGTNALRKAGFDHQLPAILREAVPCVRTIKGRYIYIYIYIYNNSYRQTCSC